MDDKGQSDKNWGDNKKSGVAKTPCQCVCHSETKPVTTTTPAAKTAVVDLTVTPCKENSEPAHTAAQHGKCFLMSMILKRSITPIWLKFFSFIMEAVFLRGRLKNKNRDNNHEVTFHANTTEITFFLLLRVDFSIH